MEISSSWARSLEPTILEWAHNGFLIHPDTTTEVFNILDKSQGIYRFNDSWGPKQIPNSTEGAATSELSSQIGHLIADSKSLLIDLEVLDKDNKAEGESHRERLNEESSPKASMRQSELYKYIKVKNWIEIFQSFVLAIDIDN
jgi:hypothetical protein